MGIVDALCGRDKDSLPKRCPGCCGLSIGGPQDLCPQDLRSSRSPPVVRRIRCKSCGRTSAVLSPPVGSGVEDAPKERERVIG